MQFTVLPLPSSSFLLLPPPSSSLVFSPLSLSFPLILSARPNVSLSASKSLASVGDDVTMTCAASGGVPSDYFFTWFNGSTMQQLLANVVSDGSMSVLTLSNIQPGDFATYICCVNNSVTQVEKQIQVEEAGIYCIMRFCMERCVTCYCIIIIS